MNREFCSCLYVDPSVDPQAHADYIGALMGQQSEAKPDDESDESSESSNSSKSEPESEPDSSDSELSDSEIELIYLDIVRNHLNKKDRLNESNVSKL